MVFFIVENLFVYLLEYVIYGEFVYEDWDVEKIKFIFNLFILENMRIDILFKFFSKFEGN